MSQTDILWLRLHDNIISKNNITAVSKNHYNKEQWICKTALQHYNQSTTY